MPNLGLNCGIGKIKSSYLYAKVGNVMSEGEEENQRLVKRFKFLVICTGGHMAYRSGGDVLAAGFKCTEFGKRRGSDGQIRIVKCGCAVTPLDSKELET